MLVLSSEEIGASNSTEASPSKLRDVYLEDGFKTFSIRIKEETVLRLDELSEETNRSRNEFINFLLDYAIDHCVVR